MEFNIDRLVLLIRKDWAENARLYGLSIVALAGVWLVLLGLFVLTGHFDTMIRIFFLMAGLFGAGAVAAQYQFKALATPAGSIRFLHLPASHLEKLAQAAFYGFAVVLPMSLAMWYCTEWIMVQITIKRFSLDPVKGPLQMLAVSDYWGPIRSYIVVNALFVLGAVFFRRAALVKSGVFVIGGLIAATMLNFFLTNALIKPGEHYSVSADLFANLNIFNRQTYAAHEIPMPAPWADVFKGFVRIVLPLFCWVTAFVRLKETEV
jgi:hypothetical protein